MKNNSRLLFIPEENKKVRQRVLQYKYGTQVQLLKAYMSKDPKRIATAKLRLSKLLREIAESSELGPVRPLKWWYPLELYISQGYDPDLGPEIIGTTDWLGLARKLETQALEIIDKITSLEKDMEDTEYLGVAKFMLMFS